MTESEHLPPIVSPPVNAFRHQSTNGSTYGFQSNSKKSPPTSAKKYITKTMNTSTTIKKAVKGGPVILNGSTLSESSRTTTSESHRKVKCP
jgi:hypothetical protein